MTIIDAIFRSTAQRVRSRTITDMAEAERLGVCVGDCVLERESIKYEPLGLQAAK